MKMIKAAHGQNLIDIAMQHMGNAVYAWDIAIANNISISDDINTGDELLLPEIEITGIEHKQVLFFKENKNQIPATANS